MRGCTQLQTGLMSPSITSSRPVDFVTAAAMGSRSVLRPKTKKSAIATKRTRTTPPIHFRARTNVPQQSACRSGGVLHGVAFLRFGEPVLAPLERRFLRQYAARSVVHVPFADAPCAEVGKDLVEPLATEVEGLGVGAVAKSKDAVANARQVRPRALQVLIKRPRVVGDVALAVSRSADEENAVAAEDAAVEAVHHQRRDLGLAVVERELHLLRAELRRAGHRADQDGHFH